MRGLAIVLFASCVLACGGGGSAGGPDGGAAGTGGSAPFAIDTSDGGFRDTVACTMTQRTMKNCIETSGLTKQVEVDYLRDGCVTPVSDASTDVHNRFDLGPCSHDHALGGCSVMSSGTTVTTNWWYGGNTEVAGVKTVNDVHSLCDAVKGTFVAP
jgi:hypothetical protein